MHRCGREGVSVRVFFSYNHLNLPSVITYSNGNSIQFVYDAAGMKLRKVVKVGATVQYEQSYLGGLEYRKNGTGSTRVEAVYHAEGRYLNLNAEVNNTLLWQKEYTLKDHLGNARISFTDKNANGIVDVPSDIVQENHYYPFGLNYEGGWRMNDAARDNKYQYNSKELNDDFGLNWNDYGFRWYDAAIGRFPSIDLLASKKHNISPYSYALNNPILYIDFLGLDTLKQLPNGDFDGGNLPVVTVTASRIDKSGKSSNNNSMLGFIGIPYNPIDLGINFESINNFFQGATNAIISNNFPWIEREEPETEEEELGQEVGDAITVLQGVVEIEFGATITGGGVGLSLTGEGIVLGVPAIVAGKVITGHGIAVGTIGLKNLLFAEHKKNRRPSNWQKHSKKRPGQEYGKAKNAKRGDKNKKYEPTPNPNKKKKN